jgi:hypothetical protein
MPKSSGIVDFRFFRSGFLNYSIRSTVLLECGVAPLGYQSPIFRDSLAVSSRKVICPVTFIGHLTLEDETTKLSRNFVHPSLSEAAPYARGTQTSTTPLRKSEALAKDVCCLIRSYSSKLNCCYISSR